MIAPVDSQGNAQLFGLRVQVYSDAANTVTLETASNSYVTKQAVKAWHKVWRSKLAEAGYSMKDLGPYGRVFKPRLKPLDSNFGSAGEVGRGEWNYSDIITRPASSGSSNALEAADLTDQYSLHLTGTTTSEDDGEETRKFTNVGMINSWLESRRAPTGASAADTVDEAQKFEQDNPLLLARGNAGSSSEMLLDEVRDLQSDEPPYDHQDFDGLYTQAIVKTNADLSAAADIVAPCGLVQVTTTAACTVLFTLVGITDM